MKKLLTLVFAAALLLTATIALAEEATDENIITDMLSRIEMEAGTIKTLEDGGVRMVALNAEGGDAYLNTWKILGRDVTNFVWSFDYTPSRVEWNQDKFCFHTTDENEWNNYELYIVGSGISDKALNIIKGEDRDNPFASAAFEMTADTTYSIRIQLIGLEVKVWFAKAGTLTDETEPVIEVTLTEGGEEYHDQFVATGDFQVVSWGSEFTLSNMELEILD